MKRASIVNHGAQKTNTFSSETIRETGVHWLKRDKRMISQAPQPMWARYIDSRLKQFVTR